MKKILLIFMLTVVSIPFATAQCTPTVQAQYDLVPSASTVAYNATTYLFAIGDQALNHPATVYFQIENLSYLTTYLIYYVDGAYVGNGSPPINFSKGAATTCLSLPGAQFSLRIQNSNTPKTPATVRVTITSITNGTIGVQTHDLTFQ